MVAVTAMVAVMAMAAAARGSAAIVVGAATAAAVALTARTCDRNIACFLIRSLVVGLSCRKLRWC